MIKQIIILFLAILLSAGLGYLLRGAVIRAPHPAHHYQLFTAEETFSHLILRIDTSNGRTWEYTGGIWTPIPDPLQTENEHEPAPKPSAEEFLNAPDPTHK